MPTVSPARISTSTFGRRPLAITTLSPADTASRAASSLLAMPPRLRLIRPRRHRRLPLKFAQRFVQLRDERNHLRRRIARMAVVQAFDIRQQHQQRRAKQIRHHRRQPIVVAHVALQLVDPHRVVFVDDRQRPVLKQRQQRVADVEITRAVVEIVGREQNLGGVPAVDLRARL